MSYSRCIASAITILAAALPANAAGYRPYDAEFLLSTGHWGPPDAGRVIRAEAASLTVSLPDDLPAWARDQALEEGDYWSSCSGAPRFLFVEDHQPADIRVHLCYADTDLPDSLHLQTYIAAFTVPIVDSLGTEIVGADIWVNARDFLIIDGCAPVRTPFGRGQRSVVIWKILFLHELGHTLGLGHARQQCSALMARTVVYYSIAGRWPCRCLPDMGDWDRKSVNFLYGAPK